MSNIDWSKAPEGTTHACVEAYGFPWRRQEGSEWFGWSYRGWETIVPNIPIYKAKPDSGWTGEGLPPLGTVCELKQRVLFTGAHDSKWFEEGDQVEVGGHALFSGAEGAVCSVCVVGQNYTGTLIHEVLRQIRTPEQIEAEQREKAIREMGVIALSSDPFTVMEGVAALYDAGYRKI